MKELKNKFKTLSWLDQLAWPGLLMASLILGLAPFAPKPHLFEKLQMLFQGNLTRPIDIFDLLMHAFPLILVAIKGLRQYRKRRAAVN